jgi:hypothetical protein
MPPPRIGARRAEPMDDGLVVVDDELIENAIAAPEALAGHRRCPITGSTQPPGPRSAPLPPPLTTPGSERTIPGKAAFCYDYHS